MSKRLQGASDGFAERLSGLRLWLRRAMPRVAAAAAALYILRLLVKDTWVYQNTPARLLGPLTLLAACSVAAYYCLKLLVRLKRLLLWRVRRRLVITYLSVGLTPIVLLLVLGGLAALGGSSQAMVRVVTVEISATERHALEGARAVASALAELPHGAPGGAAQLWLDERAALLQSSLPGARVSVWRAAQGGRAGAEEAAHIVSAKVDARTLGVGWDSGEAGEPLPAWLAGREEWSGFAHVPPPEGSNEAFGTPSVRALARSASKGGEAAVLVTVPVSRALVERLRENTGVTVRPFFLGSAAGGRPEGEDVRVEYTFDEAERERKRKAARAGAGGREVFVDFTRDQFGEKVPDISMLSFPYPVFLPATNWRTGESAPQWSFTVDWSWAEGGKQFWSDAALGEYWRRGLYIIAVAFVLLELLALFSAAWMTRAVTGTVHKLYRATEFIKRGDFSHRIRTRSRDQLGELAAAFNDMSADIQALLAERVEHERLKREIEIAHEVQAQLFPRSTPALATAEMAGECRAARGVAGDYYDFIEAAPGRVVLALGDVAGKGISAALVMSNLQAALRAQVAIIAERMRMAARTSPAVAGGQSALAAAGDGGQAVEMPCGVAGTDTQCAVSNMIESINEQLCHSTDTNRFATLFLGLYDDSTRTLRYTNAGHNAPVLVRADGSVERLTIGGTVVGAFGFVRFEEAQVTLGEGDALVLFSDGINEAQNHAGEEYGDPRLVELAVARRGETVNNLRQSIFDEVDAWAGAVERGDDQTLVILKAVTSK